MDFRELDKELADMIGETGTAVPGLGVIVFKDGQEVYEKFLGKRVIGTVSKPVTRNTRFRVASVSKMFTVFTILKLVEEGKLSLDSDVSKLLGFHLRNPTQPHMKITVRMLASHTSSLRDGTIYSLPPEVSIEECFRPNGKFWENGKHFGDGKVGNFFEYCNLNYGLLGTIIECVTGKRFDLFEKENILQQLNMKADYLPANLPKEEFEKLGTLYRKKNPQGVWNEFGEWFAQMDNFEEGHPEKDTIALQNPYSEHFNRIYKLKDYRVGTNATFFSPQGGLRISFEELAHTLEFLLHDGFFQGHQILKGQSLATMFNLRKLNEGCNGFLSYGLGTYRPNYPIKLLGHGGEAFGMVSGIFFHPKTKSGFVYMLNGQAIEPYKDPRSKGKLSGNYIWEEKLWNTLCHLFS